MSEEVNVFINYDKDTYKVKAAYGEEENTPVPFIPILISVWSDVQKYGIKNLTVDIEKKELVFPQEAVIMFNAAVVIAEATRKIAEIENNSSYKRSLRVSSLTLTSAGVIDTKSIDFKIISNYDAQIKIYASIISTGVALSEEQTAALSDLQTELNVLKKPSA